MAFEWYGPTGCCCQGPCKDYQDNHTTFSDDFNDGFDPGWEFIHVDSSVVNGRCRFTQPGGQNLAFFRCDSHSGLTISAELDVFLDGVVHNTVGITLGSLVSFPRISWSARFNPSRVPQVLFIVFHHSGILYSDEGPGYTAGDTLKMLAKPTANDTVFDFDFFVNNNLLFATTGLEFDFDRFGEAACQIPVYIFGNSLGGPPNPAVSVGECDNFIGSVTCA